jgi:hypothetical protein
MIARRKGIARQVQRHPPVRLGGRRAPHKPLLLLNALARLEHDRQADIRFNAGEAILQPLQMPEHVDTPNVRPNAHGLEA